MTSESNARHPIIIVTGANSGIGFGICHRLLVQLSRTFPDDALPRLQHKTRANYHSYQQLSPFAPATKLTLVLACRSSERAAAARQRLLDLIDAEVSFQKKGLQYDGHAEEFRRCLQIDFISLDLANMESVFEFAEEASRRYSYITHLILNAGILSLTGLNWTATLKQLLTESHVAFLDRFLLQSVAAESSDGLGLVWQSNVFGHYSLLRLLEPLLLQSPYLDSRVEWLSSIEARPGYHDLSDPQLLRTKFSYQASKYQMDLICATLAQDASRNASPGGIVRIRHLLVHPGVCSTNLVTSAVGMFIEILKTLSFYLIRLFLGMKVLNITPYNGASAASYAALVPPRFLEDSHGNPPLKYGSCTTRWGKDWVDLDLVADWENNVQAGKGLIEYCEKVFEMLKRRRGFVSPHDSGVFVG